MQLFYIYKLLTHEQHHETVDRYVSKHLKNILKSAYRLSSVNILPVYVKLNCVTTLAH